MGIDGRRHPKGESWSKRSGGGGRGGRPQDWNAYQLSMFAGLVVFTALGWRTAAELGRIRRAVGEQPRGRYREHR